MALTVRLMARVWKRKRGTGIPTFDVERNIRYPLLRLDSEIMKGASDKERAYRENVPKAELAKLDNWLQSMNEKDAEIKWTS